MGECACDCGLLGRETVQGSANADSLAALVRLVSRRARPGACRRYRLRCSREGVELRAARRLEDEGFESDDDAVSQASSDSNGSSCCLVEDHALALQSPQSLADSANGSGASDNDDDSRPKKREDSHTREIYAFNDVAFCHTDPAFPQVLVLVIKRKKSDEADPSTGLEAVIFQCKSAENVREVCVSYKEFSRRLKMDLQFRYPHRRKDIPESASALYKNVFNDLQKANASVPPTNSPFLKTWITHVSSKPQSFVKEAEYQAAESNRYNLVQRTDDDGVTHIEVSKSVDAEYVNSLITTDEYSGSSSIISISTPDVGNLVVSSGTVLPQGTHSAGEAASGSEIDGVICADVDSSPINEAKTYEKYTKNDAQSKNAKVGYQQSSAGADTPPQRPQRGVKKNASKQKEPQQTEVKSKAVSKDRGGSKTPEPTKQPGTHERVVRGQFIRVNVEQQSAPGARTGHRLFGGDLKPGALLSYPAWNVPTQRTSRSRQDNRRKSEQRRSRSSGPTGHRAAEPPAAQPSKPLSNRFFGKLKEIANMNNSYVPTLSRRRNSSGDLATAQFYQYLEPALKTSVSKSSSNLKSVIKKKNCNDNIEPKKVTFSAYATVQVVD